MNPIINGWTDEGPNIVGHAPPAPRPAWLPKEGKGQKYVAPLCWSLSIEQWVIFVRACTSTDTWRVLAKAKGSEYDITMYDMKDHFVVPWTKGTGSSIALLMNSNEKSEQQRDDSMEVELMISHAWGGSVIETYNCIQNLVNYHNVPRTARLFFCTFSMYQPEDVEETSELGGLTIGEQLDLKPFAKIINSKSLVYGMYVVHTTTFELYSRMWTVHEVDESTEHNIQTRGLFDMYRWSEENFKASVNNVNTREADCQAQDKIMLECLIEERGGFDRLDSKIRVFREKMLSELIELLSQKNPPLEIKEADHISYTSGGGSEILCLQISCLCSCIFPCCCLCETFMCEKGSRASRGANNKIGCLHKNLNYLRPAFRAFYSNYPAELSREQHTFDWVKIDKIDEKSLLKVTCVPVGNFPWIFFYYCFPDCKTESHRTEQMIFFKTPVISRSVSWKFEKDWLGPGLKSMLPLGKDSFPFGQPFREEEKRIQDHCLEKSCCIVAAPFHLISILVPPLLFFTPFVRCCPPSNLYWVLLGCDGDWNGLRGMGKEDEEEQVVMNQLGGGESLKPSATNTNGTPEEQTMERVV